MDICFKKIIAIQKLYKKNDKKGIYILKIKIVY